MSQNRKYKPVEVHPTVFFVMLIMLIMGWGLMDVFTPTTYQIVAVRIFHDYNHDFDYEEGSFGEYFDEDGNLTDDEFTDIYHLEITTWWFLDKTLYEIRDFSGRYVVFKKGDEFKSINVMETRGLRSVFIDNSGDGEFYKSPHFRDY